MTEDTRNWVLMLLMYAVGFGVGAGITYLTLKKQLLDPTAVYGELQMNNFILQDMVVARASYRLEFDAEEHNDRMKNVCIQWVIGSTLAKWPAEFVLKHPAAVNALIADKTALECKHRIYTIVEIPRLVFEDGKLKQIEVEK